MSLQRCYFRIFIATFLLALLAGVPLVAQAPAPESPKSQPGKVSGRVLRADDGRPLSKAVVTLSPEGRPREAISVRTDRSGVFDFPDVVPGRYQLRAQRSGYVPSVYGQRGAGPGLVLTVTPGQHLQKLDLRLEPGGVISGTVSDEDSEPVEGLQVQAVRLRFLPGGRQVPSASRATTTDDLGHYRLTGLPKGSYYVQAGMTTGSAVAPSALVTFSYAPTFYPRATERDEAQRVQVSAGAETRAVDVWVTTAQTFTVSGMIVDSGPSTRRRTFEIGITRGGGTVYTNVDRDDGSFSLRGLTPGEITLVGQVWEDGAPLRRGYRTVRVLNSDVRVAIEIGRTAQVRGECQMEDKEPCFFSELRVRLQPDSETAMGSFSGNLDEAGRFSIKDVTEGIYSIHFQGREQELYLKQVSCSGEDYTARPISLAADQVVDDCTMTLARDVAEVAGQARAEDVPAPGMVVVLIPVEKDRRRNPRHTSIGQTDPAGFYQIRGVIPGDYFVFALAPSDDGIYYDSDFPERNRERATRLTVKPSERHLLNLTPIRPQ